MAEVVIAVAGGAVVVVVVAGINAPEYMAELSSATATKILLA